MIQNWDGVTAGSQDLLLQPLPFDSSNAECVWIFVNRNCPHCFAWVNSDGTIMEPGAKGHLLPHPSSSCHWGSALDWLRSHGVTKPWQSAVVGAHCHRSHQRWSSVGAWDHSGQTYISSSSCHLWPNVLILERIERLVGMDPRFQSGRLLLSVPPASSFERSNDVWLTSLQVNKWNWVAMSMQH